MHEKDFLHLLIKNGWIFKINNYKKENYDYDKYIKKQGNLLKNENGIYERKTDNIIGGKTYEVIFENNGSLIYTRTICNKNDNILHKFNLVKTLDPLVIKSEIYYSAYQKKIIYYRLQFGGEGFNIIINKGVDSNGEHLFNKYVPVLAHTGYQLYKDQDSIDRFLRQINELMIN